MPTTDLWECFASVAPGLEPYALAEANEMGLGAKLTDGGITWQGDARSILTANMSMRVASRVIVRLSTFTARSFFELERHARKVQWARIVRSGDTVRFRVTCKKSRLYHSDAVAERLAAAIVRAVPGVHVENVADDDDENSNARSQLFVVRFQRDECTLSADTSGELLHRRGYRVATAKAPLRETIAAAMLMASGWDRRSPLVDPLCGAGTIPIEAALMAGTIAPGLRRRFAIERWPNFRPEDAAVVQSSLSALEKPSRAKILGSDRDAGAIEAAWGNAARAGVKPSVEFAVQSLSAATFSGGPGWIVTNPPYGVRVGDVEAVRDLWAQMGKVLHAKAPGWRLCLLSPDHALERQLRMPMKTVASIKNGGIPVRIVTGDIA